MSEVVDKENEKVSLEHKAVKADFEFEGQTLKVVVAVDINKDGQPSLKNTTELYLGETVDEVKDAIFGGDS